MAPARRKKNSGPAITKAIITRDRPEHVTIDPVLEQKLFDAYKAVTVQGQSIRQAAKTFGTSRTTLTKYLYGERRNKVVAHEYEMSLNVNYENQLENYIRFLTKCSDYINKKAVYLLANQLLELNFNDSFLDPPMASGKLENSQGVKEPKHSASAAFPAKNPKNKKTKVSQSWISKFFKRHPQLNHVKPVVFQKPRTNDSYSAILSQWYKNIDNFFKENRISPSQIYNVCEMGYLLENSHSAVSFTRKRKGQKFSADYCKIVYDVFKEADANPSSSRANAANGMPTPASPASSEALSSGSSTPDPERPASKQKISAVETMCADGSKLNTFFVLHAQVLEDMITNHSSNINNQALFDILANNNDDIVNDPQNSYTSAELSFIWLRRFDMKTRNCVATKLSAERDVLHNDSQCNKGQSEPPLRVLICNYNTCHVTLRFLKYCMKNNIVPLLLTTHLANIIQPISSQIIPSFLQKLSALLKTQYDSKFNSKDLSATEFLKIYNKTREETFCEENVRSAFERTGIVPNDSNKVLKFWRSKSTRMHSINNVYQKEFDFVDFKNGISSIAGLDLAAFYLSHLVPEQSAIQNDTLKVDQELPALCPVTNLIPTHHNMFGSSNSEQAAKLNSEFNETVISSRASSTESCHSNTYSSAQSYTDYDDDDQLSASTVYSTTDKQQTRDILGTYDIAVHNAVDDFENFLENDIDDAKHKNDFLTYWKKGLIDELNGSEDTPDSSQKLDEEVTTIDPLESVFSSSLTAHAKTKKEEETTVDQVESLLNFRKNQHSFNNLKEHGQECLFEGAKDEQSNNFSGDRELMDSFMLFPPEMLSYTNSFNQIAMS